MWSQRTSEVAAAEFNEPGFQFFLVDAMKKVCPETKVIKKVRNY